MWLLVPPLLAAPRICGRLGVCARVTSPAPAPLFPAATMPNIDLRMSVSGFHPEDPGLFDILHERVRAGHRCVCVPRPARSLLALCV